MKVNIKQIVLFAGLLFGGLAHFAMGADFSSIIPYQQGKILRHMDISADGNVIVGVMYDPRYKYTGYRLGRMSFRRNLNCSSTPCIFLHGADNIYGLTSCSGDGSLVTTNPNNPLESHIYNFSSSDCSCQASKQISLLPLSGDDYSRALDISADGSTVVGSSTDSDIVGALFLTAVRWDSNTGNVTDLGAYADDDDSDALSVSADGSVIVGKSGLYSFASYMEEDGWWRPVFWRPAYGWYPLERIYTGSYPAWSYWRLQGNIAHGVSNDGLLAVGNLYSGTHIVPVSWDLKPTSGNFTKAALLPLLAGNDYVAGRAYGASKNISGRGYVIGGYCGSDNLQFGGAGHYPLISEAVLWETEHLQGPPTRVNTLLQGLGLGNKIAGWILTDVANISDNGKVITGRGIHPNGQRWYWYADLRHPQPNNTRAHAQYIGQSVGNLVTHRARTGGSTVDASSSITPIVDEGAKLRPTVWYSYKAAQDGYLSLDLDGSISYSLLAVYKEQETSPMAWSYTCSDPDSVGPCFMPDELKIEANTMYYISVSGMEVPQGEESFSLYHQFTPITDQCVDAFFLEQILPSTVPGSTNDAATALAPTCNNVTVTGPGVWFKVVATGGLMTASLDGAVDYDSKLSVYCSGCGATPTCITASDDINDQNTASAVSWCSSPGGVYHVLVHGYGAQHGNFRLTIDEDPSVICLPSSVISCLPANSECTNDPVPLVETTSMSGNGNHTLLVDNTNAGTSTSSTACGQVNNDLWFTYTARCDGNVVIDTCQAEGSLDDTVLAVYDGCGGTELACNDDYTQEPTCGQRSAIYLPAYPGQKLKIMAADFGSHADMGTFPLRVQEEAAIMDIQEMSWPFFTEGDDIDIQLPISGGCPGANVDYTANITTGSLPPGLTLNANGHITGNATTSGRFQFTVHVTDGEIIDPGHDDSASYEMTIKPDNDTCQTAKQIVEGGVLFGNFGTTTSGPISSQCNGSPYSSDVWYSYTSACTGVASVNTCGSNFDTTLATYAGSSCTAAASLLGCNTDAPSQCGTGSTASALTFKVKKDDKYLVRIGSDGANGPQGNGTLLITCFEDCNNNGVSDLVDISNSSSRDTNNNGVPDECDPHIFSWPMFIPAIIGAGR